MFYSIISVAVNVALNFALIPVWGFAGLAAATSAAGLTNVILLIYNMKKKVAGIDYIYIISTVVKIVLGSVAAMLVIKLIDPEMLIGTRNLPGKILTVGLQIGGMGIIYLGLMRLLKVGEVNKLLALLRIKKK